MLCFEEKAEEEKQYPRLGKDFQLHVGFAWPMPAYSKQWGPSTLFSVATDINLQWPKPLETWQKGDS